MVIFVLKRVVFLSIKSVIGLNLQKNISGRISPQKKEIIFYVKKMKV